MFSFARRDDPPNDAPPAHRLAPTILYALRFAEPDWAVCCLIEREGERQREIARNDITDLLRSWSTNTAESYLGRLYNGIDGRVQRAVATMRNYDGTDEARTRLKERREEVRTAQLGAIKRERAAVAIAYALLQPEVCWAATDVAQAIAHAAVMAEKHRAKDRKEDEEDAKANRERFGEIRERMFAKLDGELTTLVTLEPGFASPEALRSQFRLVGV